MRFNFRRSYLWLLALLCACIFAAADGALAAYYDEHTGDSWEDAYIIDSAQDLQDMRLYAMNYIGYYKLANDISIDITEVGISNIGYINYFNSSFDGQGHIININIDTSGIADERYAALFGRLDGAAIKNLNVKGTVKSNAAAAGIAHDLTDATIENCSFNGTIEVNGYLDSSGVSEAKAGGIVFEAYQNSYIKNCKFSGEIRLTTNANAGSPHESAGGITALFGNSSSDSSVIDNCTVSSTSTISASLSNSNTHIGGIAGESYGGTIQNCNSAANITAKDAGGILGRRHYNSYTVLRNNTYGSYPEIGLDEGTGTPTDPTDPTNPTEPGAVNNNVIDDLKLASLDSEYEAYISAPAAYLSDPDFQGHIPSPINLEHLANNPVNVSGAFYAAADLPSSYNTQKNNMPQIRNQGSYSTCWAFAALGAMEVNYLKNNSNSNVDLSELHLAWFVFEDPRSGYKYNLHNENKETLNQGGYAEQARAFLTRMSGAVHESALPYDKAASVKSDTAGKNADDYSCYIRVKEIYDLGSRSINRDDVKRLIVQCGGVSAAYKSGGFEYLNTTTNAYYRKTDAKSGHMIVLIGWDDNYSRDNFKENERPQNNGAWLARNSHGPSYGNGSNGGYFWLSYEQLLGEVTGYEVSTAESNLVYYGWDGLGRTGAVNCEYSANVFQVKNDKETLKEVAFYTMDNNAEYTVSVYDCSGDKPVITPVNGSPVFTKSGKIDRAGYHTIDASSSSVSLSKGNWFTVVLQLKSTANCRECTAIEAPVPERSYPRGDVVINMYESLFSKDGKTWADGTNTSAVMEGGGKGTASKMNACIKAFTINCTSVNPVDPDDQNDGNNSNNNSSSTKSGGGGGGCSSGLGLASLGIIVLFTFKKR